MIRPDRALTRACVVAVVTVALAGCATTVVDDSGDTVTTVDGETVDGETVAGETVAGETVDGETVDGGAAPDSTVSTVPISGGADELLPVIGDDMRTLSDDIGGDGDQQATLARIEAAWDAIREEIESTRPELFRGLEAAIVMVRTAVVSNRPADADKAYSILIDLIDAFENAT